MGTYSRIRIAFVVVLAIVLVALLYYTPSFLEEHLDILLVGHYPRTNVIRQKVASCHSDNSADAKITKKFVYLIQTESCAPEHLLRSDVFGNSTACQCDLVVLGYKEKCKDTSHSHVTYIFNSSTTWTTGREQMYKTALKSGNKYLYYMFMDDDVVLEVVDKKNKQNAWRLFEDFLLRVRPPMAAVDTTDWRFVDRILRLREKHSCKYSFLKEDIPAVWYDGMFNAFHQDAAKNLFETLLPIWGKFDKTSWWFSQWYVCILSDVMYHYQVVHNVEVMGVNPAHRPYIRQFCDPAIMETIIADIQTVIPGELRSKADILLQEWRSDYEHRRRGLHTFCVDAPQASCIKPYEYISHF